MSVVVSSSIAFLKVLCSVARNLYIANFAATCGAIAAVAAVAIALSLVGNQTLESREQALHSKRLVTEANTLPRNTSQKVWGSEGEIPNVL